MKHKTANSPEIEQNYLTRNALLSVAMGFVFFFDVCYELLEGTKWSSGWLSNLLGGLMIIAFISLLTMLFKVIFMSGKLSKGVTWYGAYQDEFMSHVNKKGYQYSHNLMYLVSFAILVSSAIYPNIFELISTFQLTRLGIASLALTYGLPVLYLLQKESD